MSSKKQTQIAQVVETMRNNGGFARLGDLYKLLDFSTWATQTPEATVRRIVQDNSSEFFKIRAGLWALTSCREAVLKKLKLEDFDSVNPSKDTVERNEVFTHAYYQGLVVEIGNMKHLQTCVANADNNRAYLDKRLKDVVSLNHIYDFTYPDYLERAKTIDVIWFNERRLPSAFFEVEHTTNIEHSLVKFCDFQDYFARFYIVADEKRRNQFNVLLAKPIFKPLQGRVVFHNYTHLASQHSKMCELASIDTL